MKKDGTLIKQSEHETNKLFIDLLVRSCNDLSHSVKKALTFAWYELISSNETFLIFFVKNAFCKMLYCRFVWYEFWILPPFFICQRNLKSC